MLVSATAPMAILQASSTQNDLVAGLWMATSIYFGLSSLEPGAARSHLLLAASIGLAVVTKSTSLLLLVPFVLTWLYVASTRFGPRLATRTCTWATVAILALTGPHFLRVNAVWSTPLGGAVEMPAGYGYFTESRSVSAALSGLSRNLALQMTGPIEGLNSAIRSAVLGFHDLIGTDAADPRTTWPGMSLSVEDHSRNEDQAGNPAVLVLFMSAVMVLLIRRGPRRVVVLAFCCVAAFVLFSVLLRWQPWHTRLHLPLLFPVAAVVGMTVWRSTSPWAMAAGAAVLCVVAWAPLLENVRRPLLGPASVLTVEREAQYFSTAPPWRAGLVAAAQSLDGILGGGCDDIGLIFGSDDPYYPLLALSMGKNVSFRHVAVENRSRLLESPDEPCAIVISQRRDQSAVGHLERIGFRLKVDQPPVRVFVRVREDLAAWRQLVAATRLR